MINEPMWGIIQKTIEASTARNYFTQTNWEGPLRQRFRQMRDNLRKDNCSDAIRKEAVEAFRSLNYNYRTRAPLRTAGLFIGTLLGELKEQKWLESDPPALLADTVHSASADLISAVVPAILTDFKAKGGRHDYSLLTKFLHFTYPETFPIYDAQVARSVQEWAYFSFREGEERKWKEFSVGTIGNLDGSGYRHLVEFYRQFWAAACPDDQVQLRKIANEMEDIVGGKVSVLDVLDKHLWIANGNAVILGLLD